MVRQFLLSAPLSGLWSYIAVDIWIPVFSRMILSGQLLWETFVRNLLWDSCTHVLWSFDRSADAQYVAVSSQDGYCSLFSFTDAELGVQMPCSGTFLINFPHSPVGFCHSQLCVVSVFLGSGKFSTCSWWSPFPFQIQVSAILDVR
jgi:hypothetical protein